MFEEFKRKKKQSQKEIDNLATLKLYEKMGTALIKIEDTNKNFNDDVRPSLITSKQGYYIELGLFRKASVKYYAKNNVIYKTKDDVIIANFTTVEEALQDYINMIK